MNRVPQEAPRENEAIRTTLEGVLARPEFQREETMAEKFFAWLEDIFPDVSPGTLTAVVQIAYWAVIILLIGVLVWMIVRIVSNTRGRRGPVASVDAYKQEVADAVAALTRRAREAEANRDWVRALRLYFFALVVGLGERGDLEYRDAWTNRELLRRGEPSPEVERALTPVVDELDRKGFGDEPTSAADVRRMEALLARWVGGVA